jgi:hypothetical protein
MNELSASTKKDEPNYSAKEVAAKSIIARRIGYPIQSERGVSTLHLSPIFSGRKSTPQGFSNLSSKLVRSNKRHTMDTKIRATIYPTSKY